MEHTSAAARKLDTLAVALVEPVIDEALGCVRSARPCVAVSRTPHVVSVRDIDPIWLNLQLHQITMWANGSPYQRRAAALLDLLLPGVAAAGVEPPSIPPMVEP